MTTRLPALAAAAALLALLAGCGGDTDDAGPSEPTSTSAAASDASPTEPTEPTAAPSSSPAEASGDPLQIRRVVTSDVMPAACQPAPQPDGPTAQDAVDPCDLDAVDCDRPVYVPPGRPMLACEAVAPTAEGGVDLPGPIRYSLEPAAVVGGVVDATASMPEGQTTWVVTFELAGKSRQAFAELSSEAAKGEQGDSVAIVVDGQVVTATYFTSAITNGRAQISGSFTEAEAQQLAAAIRAGG